MKSFGAKVKEQRGNLGLSQKQLAEKAGPICAIMVALYITQDSFGTACNISGDNAIGVIVDTIYHKFIIKETQEA